jgi:ribosome-associated protein
MTTEEKIAVIVKALDSKRAEDIRVIKISDLTILADYFVIANGTSTTQTKALAEEVDYKMSEEGVEPRSYEKDNGNNWLVIDYNDIVVHVFYRDTREFYNLENLWADGEDVDISDYLTED